MNEAAKQSKQPEIPCICCGACCRWEGQVKIEDEEIHRIADYLQLSETEFIAKYTELRRDRLGLGVLMLEDGSCVFLENNKCRIHPVKPSQCAGYPLKWRNPDSILHCHAVQVLVKQGIIKNEKSEPDI